MFLSWKGKQQKRRKESADRLVKEFLILYSQTAEQRGCVGTCAGAVRDRVPHAGPAAHPLLLGKKMGKKRRIRLLHHDAAVNPLRNPQHAPATPQQCGDCCAVSPSPTTTPPDSIHSPRTHAVARTCGPSKNVARRRHNRLILEFATCTSSSDRVHSVQDHGHSTRPVYPTSVLL